MDSLLSSTGMSRSPSRKASDEFAPPVLSAEPPGHSYKGVCCALLLTPYNLSECGLNEQPDFAVNYQQAAELVPL